MGTMNGTRQRYNWLTSKSNIIIRLIEIPISIEPIIRSVIPLRRSSSKASKQGKEDENI